MSKNRLLGVAPSLWLPQDKCKDSDYFSESKGIREIIDFFDGVKLSCRTGRTSRTGRTFGKLEVVIESS